MLHIAGEALVHVLQNPSAFCRLICPVASHLEAPTISKNLAHLLHRDVYIMEHEVLKPIASAATLLIGHVICSAMPQAGSTVILQKARSLATWLHKNRKVLLKERDTLEHYAVSSILQTVR